MAIQYSVTHQTNNVTDIVTLASTTAYLLIYTGAKHLRSPLCGVATTA